MASLRSGTVHAELDGNAQIDGRSLEPGRTISAPVAEWAVRSTPQRARDSQEADMTARRTLSALLFSVLFVPCAHAAGISLRWDNCFGDAGAINKNFACNTNNGVNILAESFVLAAAVNNIAIVDSDIEITTASATLPAWWELFNAGTCRENSLAAASPVSAQAVACLDWAGGQGGTASVNIASYTIGAFGPSTASLRTYAAVLSSNLANLSAGQEYGAITLRINHTKTLGFGIVPACAGCSTPACIYLRRVRLFDNVSPTPVVTLTAAANGTDSNTATWQGGTGVPALPGGACSGAVPVRNSTWGSVKALYR